MARRSPPPVSYDDDLALPGSESPAPLPTPAAGSAAPPAPVLQSVAEAPAPEPVPVRSARRPILDKSDPTIVYLDPRGKHQLRQYAVAQGLKVRVHDLLCSASTFMSG